VKVIKGEKYLCSKGPKKAMIFKVMGFTEHHVVCENMSYPANGMEMIVKFYFRNAFKEYNHRANVKLDMISVQQIIFAINTKIKTYVDNEAMSDSLFRLISDDVGKVLFTDFMGEIE
jgi:hypothetical protein